MEKHFLTFNSKKEWKEAFTILEKLPGVKIINKKPKYCFVEILIDNAIDTVDGIDNVLTSQNIPVEWD